MEVNVIARVQEKPLKYPKPACLSRNNVPVIEDHLETTLNSFVGNYFLPQKYFQWKLLTI